MSVRRILAFAVLLSAPFALADGEAAERPAARLEYTKKQGTNACPDDTAVRDSVAARLGYDPFQPDAKRVIRVTVTHDAKGFHATLEEGAGVRKLDSKSPDCADLASSIAVSLATAIDPLGIGASVSASASSSSSIPAPAPSPAPASASASASTSASEPEPPKPSEIALVPTVGVHAAFGAEPESVPGFTAGFALRWTHFQIGLEGRIDAEGHSTGKYGTVKSSIVAGSIVPCGQYEMLFGCVFFSYGRTRGEGYSQDNTLFVGGGIRVGLELPLVGPIALRVHGDGVANFTPTSLSIGPKDDPDSFVWRSPILHAIFGVELAGIFR